jgi:hypothetical protein
MGLPVKATSPGLLPGPPTEVSGPDEKFVSGPTPKVDRKKILTLNRKIKLTAQLLGLGRKGLICAIDE